MKFINEITRFIFSVIIAGISFCAAAQSSIPTRDTYYQQKEKLPTRLSEGVWAVPVWSLKTNGIYWLATIPNLTGEVRVGKHVAIDLGVAWCPWKISDRYSLKVLSIMPAARWWFNERADGHFIDIHLTGAWYNLRWKSDRYQDVNRPALGAGISYGYQFTFTENWGLELQIGAGYVNTRYNTYYNIKNGALIDTRRTSYWGIDRLGVSLVYCFTP